MEIPVVDAAGIADVVEVEARLEVVVALRTKTPSELVEVDATSGMDVEITMSESVGVAVDDDVEEM